MITISKPLLGIIPYAAVYYPTDEFVREATERLKPLQMVRLFFSQLDLADARCVVRHHISTTAWVDLTQPAEDIWKRVDARSSRFRIRRAEKLGDRVKIARNGAEAHDFLPLYNEFAQKKGDISGISPKVLERFKGQTDIFMAYFDDKPMGGHVVLRDKEAGIARLLYSGSRRLEDRESAQVSGDLNRLLHWREMQIYKEEGLGLYDFGGVREDPADGIAKFKLSFGGTIVKEHSYLCAWAPKIAEVAQFAFENLTSRGRFWRAKLAAEQPQP